MRKFLLASSILLAAAPASLRAATVTPEIFMHVEQIGKMPCYTANLGTACALPKPDQVLLPHIAGAQLSLPWSAVQTTDPAAFDWTKVENVIRPWIAAGKKVGISFHGVEEAAGVDATGIPATPAFILSPPAGTAGPLLIACTLVSGGVSYLAPVVPVYWDPLYSTPWRAFAAAAIKYFAWRPNIAYLRFGEGEGDESMLEVTKTIAGGQDTPTSIAACNSLWNAADAKVGQHGVFADQLAQAETLVTYLGQVAKATPSAKPLFGSYNDLGNVQAHQLPLPHPFADPLAAAEAAAGMAPGNEGFGDPVFGAGNYTGNFGGIYGWTDPYFATVHAAKPKAMYMQTSSPIKLATYTTLPNILQAGMSYGIGTFEMYSGDLFVAFDPGNLSGMNQYTGTSPSRACLSTQVTTVLAGLAIPSCH